jgi:hypothetical protein
MKILGIGFLLRYGPSRFLGGEERKHTWPFVGACICEVKDLDTREYNTRLGLPEYLTTYRPSPSHGTSPNGKGAMHTF